MEFHPIVRAAGPRDAGAFAWLNRQFNGEGVASEEEAAAALSQPGPERVLLAFVEEEPAGFLCGLLKRSACYGEPSAEVTELYVRPEHRRRGVARALLEQFLAACRREGVREVTVLTGDDNRTARACYETLGFSCSGEVHYQQEL